MINFTLHHNKNEISWHRWLMPVILTTWEAEIGRIKVRGQSREIVCGAPSPKQPEQNGLELWLKQRANSSTAKKKKRRKQMGSAHGASYYSMR
jgi:hypothetical protein